MPDIIARAAFPGILKKYMNRDHISQSYIAKHLNVSKQTVSDWVHGNKFPRVDKMQELADLFGVLMSDMYNPSQIKSSELDEKEIKLISLWRGAETSAQNIAFETLMNHQKKDTKSSVI